MTTAEYERIMGRTGDVNVSGELRAGSIVEFMVFPGGTTEASFGVGLPGGIRTSTTKVLKIDASTAKDFNEALFLANHRSKQRAYLDFDHDDREASAWPKEYLWRETPAPGVYVRAELSEAGARAISGKNYRGFSPTFNSTRGDHVATVSPPSGLNFGGFVNDPAFTENVPLFAKSGLKQVRWEDVGDLCADEKAKLLYPEIYLSACQAANRKQEFDDECDRLLSKCQEVGRQISDLVAECGIEPKETKKARRSVNDWREIFAQP